MSVVALRFHDRWGNRLFQYAWARAYAERIGAELQTDPWDGQRVFGLTEKPIKHDLPLRADMDFEQWDGEGDIELTGWALHQKCLLYSRADVKKWLKFTDEIEMELEFVYRRKIVQHMRWGDFKTMPDFVAISSESYQRAIYKFLPDWEPLGHMVCSWAPLRSPNLEKMGLDWLPDFRVLMLAQNLFRANSTFSWWAATPGCNDRIFSPQLKGVTPEAYVFQNVHFEEGNHCAISCFHPNCSDLYLREI
jgi:hypothetical protein